MISCIIIAREFGKIQKSRSRTENNGEAIIEAYQNVNPSVEAVMIKETKHFPHVEAPEQFLEQVGIFF